MRLLLDTHAFLWFVTNDPQLSGPAKALIADPNNEVWVSPASYWEIAIKVSIGKYPLHSPFEAFIVKGLADNRFKVLPIEPKHAAALIGLPVHQRDPIGRLLIAQALVEQIPLVSVDFLLDSYPINRLW